MASALPPIDSSALPADVRKAGPDAQKLYAAALSFESVLTQQLAQALTSSMTDDGSSDDGSSSDATTNSYAQMLPDAFAQSVASAGGLGLAPQLYQSLKGSS